MTRRLGSAASSTVAPKDALGLVAANKPREALAAAEEALALDPHSVRALKGRAFALLALGRTKQTLQAADDVLRASPTDPAGHFVKALLWARHRSWRKADLEFRRALELAPNQLGILTSYAKMLLQRSDLAQAGQILDRCVAIRPDDQNTILLRGEIALRWGRRDEAKDYAKWALSLNAKNAAALSLHTRSDTGAFPLIRRLILPYVILVILLPVANRFLPIGKNSVLVAGSIVGIAVSFIYVSLRAYVGRRVRREMRDVELRKDF